MTKPSILVENLNKEFQLGAAAAETMLQDAVMGFLKNPFSARKPGTKLMALKDVNIRVNQGEVLGLIGRNGAGKSTLLKVLSKIIYPTSGKVEVNGRVASLLEVGTGFHEELSGRENIFLNGSILGMRKKEIANKMDAIVAFSGVEKFLDTPIKRYSSGMRLRLGFAVAAQLEPDVMFVDEVLAVGDQEFQRKCLDAMSRLHQGGRTVVFVSHNMAAVENLCDRVIWIDQGRVRADGPAHEVVGSYLSSLVDLEAGGFDLKDFAHRKGTGAVRIQKLEILDTENALKTMVRSGDAVRIRFHFEVKEKVDQPHFGIAFQTELGTLVNESSTFLTGTEIQEMSPGNHTIDFTIKFLNLMPARYYLTLKCARTGGPTYDILENCAFFDVEYSNFYQSGRGIENRFGIVFFDCSWKLSG